SILSTRGRRSWTTVFQGPAASSSMGTPRNALASRSTSGSGWKAATGSIYRPSADSSTTAQKSPVARDMCSATMASKASTFGTASLKASDAAAVAASGQGASTEEPAAGADARLTTG